MRLVAALHLTAAAQQDTIWHMPELAPTTLEPNTRSTEVGPVIRLRVSLLRSPWRMGPAWAVLAGALAGGVSLHDSGTLLGLIGSIILADSAWGGLWRLTPAGSSAPGIGDPVLHWPYAQPDAPAARALRSLGRIVPGATAQELAAAVLLTGGLSLLLGMPALLLSLLAVATAMAAWVLADHGGKPALAYALLAVGLPWLLGAILAAGGRAVWPANGLVLAAAFTVLQWGIYRAYLSAHGSTWAAWLGQCVVLLVLIGLRQPGVTAIVAALFLLPSWCLLRPAGDRAQALAAGAPWWWAAALLAAVVIR